MPEDSNSNTPSPPKKRRGRPRKTGASNQITSRKTKSTVEVEAPQKESSAQEEEIILHLPITMKDLGRKTSSKIETVDKSSSPPNTNIFTITDMSYGSSSSEEEYALKNQKELIARNKLLESEIHKLTDELKRLRHASKVKEDTGPYEDVAYKMDLDFIDHETGKQIVVEKTNIACWWCTEAFETVPCFIPEKCIDGTYYVWGNFCSYNCAAKYNFDIDDYKSWDRYTLIKRLYNTIYSNFDDVPLADDRFSLKKFGGRQTLEEFRKNAKVCEKEYRFVMPPMISITPVIEERYNDHHMKSNRGRGSNENLVLKRSKPLPRTKNTLIESMGIITKKKKTK